MGEQKWMKTTILGIILGTLIVYFVTLTFGELLRQALNTDNPSNFISLLATAVNSVATTVLALLTAWYAFTTYKLLQTTQEQVEVNKRSFAPKIDATLKPGENCLFLDAINRGEGTAVNIRVVVEIQGSDKIYKYIYKITGSLETGKTLSEIPQNNDVTLGSLSGSFLTVAPKFHILPTSNTFINGADSIEEMVEELDEIEVDENAFNATGDLMELLSYLYENDIRTPLMDVRVVYEDLNGETQDVEVIEEEKPLIMPSSDLINAYENVGNIWELGPKRGRVEKLKRMISASLPLPNNKIESPPAYIEGSENQ